MPALDMTAMAKPVNAISPGTQTGTVTGNSIDTKGFEYAAFFVALGALANTSTITALKVQESSDDSTWTDLVDVQDATVTGAFANPDTSADDNTVLAAQVRCFDHKRYLRLVATVGGSGDADFGALCLLTMPKDVTQQIAAGTYSFSL